MGDGSDGSDGGDGGDGGNNDDEQTTIVVTTCEDRKGRDRRSPTGCRKECWYDEEVVQSSPRNSSQRKTNTEPYFLIQNSWGTDWGESGFVRMKAEFSGNGACGMNVEPFWVDGN